ncbi:MAG: CocE/NonD family hydrolase [Synechococcus sp.]
MTLAARRWRPEGPGPWPVLLMRQPYGRAIASTPTYAHPSWYAGHGFQVVVVDVRGRGDSGGHFAGFAQEAADGADAVRWARRLGGSDGRVGGYGFSYQGLTQLLTDGTEPDALLDALAPAHCGLDERLHWASEGGAHWWALGLGWALQLAAQGCRRRGDAAGWREIRRSLESGAFLQEGEALLERLDPGGMGLAWLRRDASAAAGWTVHEPPPELLRRPLLLIGGWHDPHLRGVLDLWQRARQAGGSPWLRIGAWSHLHWRGGIDALQLAFFQHALPLRRAAAPPPEAPPPLLLERLGSGDWTAADLRSARGGVWGLASGGLAAIRSDEGRLVPHPSAGAAGGSVTLVHDPWRPVPGRGGHLGLDAGPVDRADLDQRADVACFTSDPLREPLELFGEPLLELAVAADQPGYDLCAALSVVAAEGGAVRQWSTGVLRCHDEAPGPPRPRRLRLQPVLLPLQPGERLRLSVAAAAWPQIGVHSGDPRHPPGSPGIHHRVISLQLVLQEARLWMRPLGGEPPQGFPPD